MATIILNHKVNNYESWKALYDADLPRRASAGLTELAVGQKSGEPGNVFVIFQSDDLNVFNNMINDPELAKVMQEGGVISAPEVTIID